MDAVAEHISDGEENSAVVGVGLPVKEEAGRQDLADIVDFARVIENSGRKDGHVRGVEDVAVVEERSYDPHDDGETADYIHGSPKGHQERRTDVGDLGPVKGHWEEAKTRGHAKQVCEDDALWRKPRNDVEVAESRH